MARREREREREKDRQKDREREREKERETEHDNYCFQTKRWRKIEGLKKRDQE